VTVPDPAGVTVIKRAGEWPAERPTFGNPDRLWSRLAQPRPDSLTLANAPYPITAAVDRITTHSWGAGVQGAVQPIEPWQLRALHFERIVGEFGGAASYMERANQKLIVVPRLKDTTGGNAPDDHPAAISIARQVDDRLDLGRAARLLFVIADCYLSVQRDGEGRLSFRVLSPSEIEPWRGGYGTRTRPEVTPTMLWHENMPAQDRPALYRVYQSDTEFSGRPMGWAGRVIDSLEAVVLMTKQSANPVLLVLGSCISRMSQQPRGSPPRTRSASSNRQSLTG
jgi:hypothetical protein